MKSAGLRTHTLVGVAAALLMRDRLFVFTDVWNYAADVAFFVPESAIAEAQEHLPATLQKRRLPADYGTPFIIIIQSRFSNKANIFSLVADFVF